MKNYCLPLIPFAVFAGLAAGPCYAKDTPQEKVSEQHCEKQEARKGHGETPSKLICKTKRLFQTRIRVKPVAEPVEMTVGSPPMVSDDTDTPGDGNWEVNVVAAADLAPDSRSYQLPLLDLNYGIGDRFQLKYEVPYVYLRMTDDTGVTSSASGVADSVFGVKYRFYDDDESGLSLAVYPQIEARTPGSRLVADGGTAEGGTTFELPLLLTQEFQHVSLTANLGLEQGSAHPHSSGFASVGAGTRLTPAFAVMAEIAIAEFNLPDVRRTRLNLGGRWKLDPHQALVAAVGHDLQAPADLETQWHLVLGYQHFFGTAN